MQVDTWDKLLNIAFMIFWFGIWTDHSREIQYNPFLAPITRWLQTSIKFVRDIFSSLSDRAICIFILLLLLAFRAVAFSFGNTSWSLTFGIVQIGSPPAGHFFHAFLFSLCSLGILLFQIWSISLFFVRDRRQTAFDNSRGALYWLARPFCDARLELRPAILVGAGMLLAIAMQIASNPGLNIITGSGGIVPLVARAFIIALGGVASVFAILRGALIVLIIGSWIAMFTGSHGLMMFCHNWTGTLMGPLRRYPLRIGPLDLTPIVMIFLLEFIHKLLMGILRNSYSNLF